MEDLQEKGGTDREFEEEYYLQKSAVDDAGGLYDVDGSGGSLADDADNRWYACESACVDSNSSGGVSSGGRCGGCGAMGEYAGDGTIDIQSTRVMAIYRKLRRGFCYHGKLYEQAVSGVFQI